MKLLRRLLNTLRITSRLPIKSIVSMPYPWVAIGYIMYHYDWGWERTYAVYVPETQQIHHFEMDDVQIVTNLASLKIFFDRIKHTDEHGFFREHVSDDHTFLEALIKNKVIR